MDIPLRQMGLANSPSSLTARSEDARENPISLAACGFALANPRER
jgi:hypothetical protein